MDFKCIENQINQAFDKLPVAQAPESMDFELCDISSIAAAAFKEIPKEDYPQNIGNRITLRQWLGESITHPNTIWCCSLLFFVVFPQALLAHDALLGNNSVTEVDVARRAVAGAVGMLLPSLYWIGRVFTYPFIQPMSTEIHQFFLKKLGSNPSLKDLLSLESPPRWNARFNKDEIIDYALLDVTLSKEVLRQPEERAKAYAQYCKLYDCFDILVEWQKANQDLVSEAAKNALEVSVSRQKYIDLKASLSEIEGSRFGASMSRKLEECYHERIAPVEDWETRHVEKIDRIYQEKLEFLKKQVQELG